MTIFLIVLLTALVFEYINGFHDAANAIATVVSTKVLTPRQAIALAAVFNLLGALMGTAVASTIGKGLVDTDYVTMVTIFSGLVGAIIWNVLTWWLGLPSSSSHALIGGLCGAALASSGGKWEVLVWSAHTGSGSAGLFTGTKSGAFDHLPAWASFLRTPDFKIDQWVVVTCALVMAAGTAAGGWRIIRTMGHKMVKLQPVHGFAAETTAAGIIHIASTLGIPLSTTHAISTSIMGVGAVKRFGAVKWGIVERIVWAWVFTLPACGLFGYLTELLCRHFGME
jgi:PiT family inorganic phosphate transporter